MHAVPAVIKLPERILSPSFLRTGLDSPVSMDSLTSRPLQLYTDPSVTIWSPEATRIMSSRTISLTGISVLSPSRSAFTFVVVMTDSLSIRDLTFSSWIIPISVLLIQVPRKRTFLIWPVIRTRTASAIFKRLKYVSVWLATMRPTDFCPFGTVTLTSPCCTRYWTSSAVRPVLRMSAISRSAGFGMSATSVLTGSSVFAGSCFLREDGFFRDRAF